MNKKFYALILSSVVVVGLILTSAFIVREGQQALILQFGRPIKKSLSEPGVYFKIPFIQNVMYLEKRILTWDGDPNQIPTKDKKYIHVDTTARWKIIDPLKFIETVQNMRGAHARLGDIIDALTRDTVSGHGLVEAVRNSNAIISQMDKIKEESDNEVFGEIEEIKIGREQLSTIVAKQSDKEMRQYGIQIIDVQLRRISYEKTVEAKVYDRMISERQRIAEKILAFGKGEQAKIQGRLNRDLQKIESLAYKKAQEIRGKAEGESIRIYAKVAKKDANFFNFMRTLDAYKKSFGESTKFFLSPKMKFLELMSEGP